MTLRPTRAAILLACAGFALGVTTLSARSEDNVVNLPCMPKSEIPEIEKFKPLSRDGWLAARVIFYSAPNTPTVFPPGNKAMIKIESEEKAWLIFIDGETACAPIGISKELIAMFDQIAKGTVTHAPGRM